MSNSLIIVSAVGGGTTIDNSTRFQPITGRFRPAGIGTEAQAQMPIRDAGVAKNLYAYVSANTASVTSTLTLRVSGADSTLTVSIGSDATGIFEDTTNTPTIAATDELCWEITVPNEVGTNQLTFSIISFEFVPDTTTNTITILGVGASGSSGFNVSSTTSYLAPVGDQIITTTEADAKLRIRQSFTAQDLAIYVQTNSRVNDTLFRTRKNGANGNQLITLGAGVTGLVEDNTNTDSLAAGDDYNYSFTTNAGTEALIVTIFSTTLINTSNYFILGQGLVTGQTIPINTTTYLPIAGAMIEDATEANQQVLPRFNFTVSELSFRVSANTVTTSASTVTVRDNGADSSLTASIAAGATGNFGDTSNSFTVTGGTDEIDIKVVTPNTTGDLTFTEMSVLGQIPIPGGRRLQHLMLLGVG